jgi:hypothetical protein
MLGSVGGGAFRPSGYLTREEFELFKKTSKERCFQTAHDFQSLAIALCDSGRFALSSPLLLPPHPHTGLLAAAYLSCRKRLTDCVSVCLSVCVCVCVQLLLHHERPGASLSLSLSPPPLAHHHHQRLPPFICIQSAFHSP